MFEQLCCHSCKGLRCHCTMTELPAAPAWSRQNKPQNKPRNTEFPQQGCKETKQLQNNSVVNFPGAELPNQQFQGGLDKPELSAGLHGSLAESNPWPPENPARLHKLLPARNTTLTDFSTAWSIALHLSRDVLRMEPTLDYCQEKSSYRNEK